MAAELGRLGYIAAPFAGNVPLYDLMAADSQGHAMPIQVKAINKGSWQYSVDTFLNIEVENGHQIVKGKKKLPNPNLICIFVLLKGRGKDEFYVFRLSDLQEFTAKIYKGPARIPRIQTPPLRSDAAAIQRLQGKLEALGDLPCSLQTLTPSCNNI